MHSSRNKMAAISQTTFLDTFSSVTFTVFLFEFHIEMCSHGSNHQYTIIVSNNGLAANRRQAIVSINDA